MSILLKDSKHKQNEFFTQLFIMVFLIKLKIGNNWEINTCVLSRLIHIVQLKYNANAILVLLQRSLNFLCIQISTGVYQIGFIFCIYRGSLKKHICLFLLYLIKVVQENTNSNKNQNSRYLLKRSENIFKNWMLLTEIAIQISIVCF